MEFKRHCYWGHWVTGVGIMAVGEWSMKNLELGGPTQSRNTYLRRAFNIRQGFKQQQANKQTKNNNKEYAVGTLWPMTPKIWTIIPFKEKHLSIPGIWDEEKEEKPRQCCQGYRWRSRQTGSWESWESFIRLSELSVLSLAKNSGKMKI